MTQDLVSAFAAAAGNASLLPSIEPALRFGKLKTTDNCNSRCITCSYWQKTHENELSLAEIFDAITQMRAVGVEHLMFTGGEPTLRKELPEMVAAAKAAGFQGIGMTTNSLSLNEDRIDALVAAGLDEVVLSFEGLDKHDEIRGVLGNLKKIQRNLVHLANLRDGGARVTVKLAMTLMAPTFDQVEGALALARQFKAPLLFNLIDQGTYFFQDVSGSLFEVADWPAFDGLIDRLVAVKTAEPGLIGNSLASLDYAKRYFRDPKQAGIPCYLGYIGIEVDANGDVFSNCWGLPPVGNLRATTLADIVAAPAFKQRLADMYHKRCGGCSCGYVLNLAFHPGAAQPSARLGYAGEMS